MATTNGNLHQDQYKPSEGYTSATESAPDQSSSGGPNHDLSKDEVGWYFVEQYYTTLSKSPEKLHVCHTSGSIRWRAPKKTGDANGNTIIALLRQAFPVRIWPGG